MWNDYFNNNWRSVSSVIRQKSESQNGGNKKTKHAKFSQKTNISYPLIRICYIRFEIRPFALLPTVFKKTFKLNSAVKNQHYDCCLYFQFPISFSTCGFLTFYCFYWQGSNLSFCYVTDLFAIRVVFRTFSDIWDGVFLQKYLTAKGLSLILEKALS